MYQILQTAVEKDLFHEVADKKTQEINEMAESITAQIFDDHLENSEKPGFLNQEEFQRVLDEKLKHDPFLMDYFKNRFEEIDENGDGVLERSEIKQCCVHVITRTYDRQLENHFVMQEQQNPAQEVIDSMFT